MNEFADAVTGWLVESWEKNWPDITHTDKDGTQYIELEVPGAVPGSVDIQAEGHVLHIKVETERRGGKRLFKRDYLLSRTINIDAITAQVKNGLLTITLPKKPESKVKVVEVSIT
jgi:HSP20 family protein